MTLYTFDKDSRRKVCMQWSLRYQLASADGRR